MRLGPPFPVVLLMLCASVVSGQSWLDRVKKKVEQKAGQRADGKIDEAIDRGLDSMENANKCVAADQACIDKAQKKGKKVVLVDDERNPLPDGQQTAGGPVFPPRPPREGRPVRSGRCRGGYESTPTSSPAAV